MGTGSHSARGAPASAVQQYLQLKQRGRGDARDAAIEGLWSLSRAVGAGVDVRTVFVCHELVRGPDTPAVLAVVRSRGTRVVEVGRRTIERMTARDGPNGIAAIVRLRAWSLDSLATSRNSRVLVADRPELPGNIGTLIRCADGAGATGIVLTDPRARVLHPQAIKASMGTIFSMPVVETTAPAAVAWARRRRMRVVAADPGASTSYRTSELRGPVVVVVGSERFGLSELWRNSADLLVGIPMLGTADSLNVGQAAALILYEAAHQTRMNVEA